MAIPLVNSVASWFLKKRFHQIDLFLKYPYEVQNELLTNLLELSKNTEIGQNMILNPSHHIENLPNAYRFQLTKITINSLNVRVKGEQHIFWPKPIKWFAKSSGTTNAKSKFIPVSNASLEDCHYGLEKIYCVCI